MTTDKIIAAAREAGFEVHPRKQQARVGWDTLTGNDSTPKLAAFYAIAYRAGMERAAEICEARRAYESSAAAHHAGNWQPAFEFHTTRHAAMVDVRDTIRDHAKSLDMTPASRKENEGN